MKQHQIDAAALAAELEAVKKERDELRDLAPRHGNSVTYLRKEREAHEETKKLLDDARKERDELAAHVERFRSVVVAMKENNRYAAGTPDIIIASVWMMAQETPVQSLEALKAQWQAEGALMFSAYALVKHKYDFIEWAKKYADEIRWSASGSDE